MSATSVAIGSAWNVADDKEFPSGAFLEALPSAEGHLTRSRSHV